MGLIKALTGAGGGVLADQWREYFYCGSLPSDMADQLSPAILLKKGEKRTSNKGRSTNYKAEDNIISNGSVIAVNEGQCMIIVDQGRIAEVCAEAGEFTYDASTEPSIFCGGFGKGILDSFRTFGKRFTFGGDTAKDQRVYFFNTKKVLNNKFGTTSPVPFRFVDHKIGLDVDASVRVNGKYSFKLVDPILFYKEISGNVVDTYEASNLAEQLKTELLSALQPVLSVVGAQGIRYSELPAHTKEFTAALNEELSDWIGKWGIAIDSVAINGITAPPEIEQMIVELQKTAVYRSPDMAAAALVGAQSEAMKAAAANPTAGPMMAFAGMNMAQNAGGMNATQLFGMAQNQNNAPQGYGAPQGNAGGQGYGAPQGNVGGQAPVGGGGAAVNGWVCPKCGAADNTGRFCRECGAPKPSDAGWTCACGATNQGKFCQQCGKPKPAGAPLYRCDKCGWEPEDPAHPPKFCPECGDPFDEKDVK